MSPTVSLSTGALTRDPIQTDHTEIDWPKWPLW